MRVTCEHCGTAVDTEKEKRCSSCGASYADNKDYLQEKEFSRKSKEYDLKQREAIAKGYDINKENQEKSKINKYSFSKSRLGFMLTLILIAIIIKIVVDIIMKIIK